MPTARLWQVLSPRGSTPATPRTAVSYPRSTKKRRSILTVSSEIDGSSLPQAPSRHGNMYTSPPSVLQSSTITSPPQASDSGPRSSSGAPLSIGDLVHPSTGRSSQYGGVTDPSLSGLNYPFPANTIAYDETYFYGSDGSPSPASDNYGRYHRQSISSASSVVAFDPQVSPMMTTSMPAGTWMPATAPPMVLPSTLYEEGSNPYMPVSIDEYLPAPMLRLISPLQSLHCQYPSTNWTDMNMLRYSGSYPLYPDSYSSHMGTLYDGIA